MTRLTSTPVKSETLDKILKAADLAKQAPSSHNCQPWALHLEPRSDGLDDIYLGGAKGQAGQLYIQTNDHRFVPAIDSPWRLHKEREDVGALFFDADGGAFI